MIGDQKNLTAKRSKIKIKKIKKLNLFQKLIFINEIKKKKCKKILKISQHDLLSETAHCPPLDEYCAKILMMPSSRIEKKRIKSKLTNFIFNSKWSM